MTAETPAISLRDVRFSWRAHLSPLLEIPSFDLARGELVFVGGPSGSGKSTLLGLLGGVQVPSQGEVRVLGQDLGAMSARSRDRMRADHIGFVFQLFNLLPFLSVLDNITLPCRYSPARRERIHRAGTSDHAEANRLLDALELERQHRSRPATELSIGQQQRVAVARAMIGGPEILIADEPTSALDEGTRERFLDLLFAQCREAGTSLVLVSHDQRLSARFDRAISLPTLNRASAPPMSAA